MEQMPGISPLGLSSSVTCALCEHRLGLGPSGAQPCAGDWNSAGLTAHPRCVQHLSAVNSCRAKGSHLSMGNPLVCKDGGALVWKDLVKIRCRVCTRKKITTTHFWVLVMLWVLTKLHLMSCHHPSITSPTLLLSEHNLVLARSWENLGSGPGFCPQYPALFPPSTVFITLFRELC